MKQFLLPIVLICFTILCLAFIHIDNMNKLNQEKMALGKHENTEVYSELIH